MVSTPIPEPRRIRPVTLDDADPDRRNEALIIEIDQLKEELADRNQSLIELANRVAALYGIQAIGQLTPDQVHGLYADVEKAIEAFVGPMDTFIRQNAEHKARVDAAMQREGSAMAFRAAISGNADLQAAVVNPDTRVIDIWVAFIWRFLMNWVFADDAVLDFYDADQGDQSPAYYIKNLNEMEHLMTQAREPTFGLYARRLWRRQALSAIFRTGDFEWVTSIRAAKMEALSQNLFRAFQVFARPFPDGTALELTRAIVAAAVRLSEHIMVEADDIWTIELEGAVGSSEDDFYDNLDDFGLKAVGTDQGLRDNAPLDSLKRRLSLDVIKDRVKKLCVVRPALRYRHVEPDGEGYGDIVHKVRPQVLVALKEIPWPEGRLAVYTVYDEMVFYNMAKSLGLVTEPLEKQ